MEFTVLERLILLKVIPKEGDYTTLKIVRKLREELSFSEEEHKLFKFEEDPKTGMIRWQNFGIMVKAIEIGEKAFDIISEAFKTLEKAKKLHEEMVPLYEKFVLGNKKGGL